jgi:hypothetical protein
MCNTYVHIIQINMKKILEMDFAKLELRAAAFVAKGIGKYPLPVVKRKSEPNMQYIKPEPNEPSGCLGYWSGFDPRDFDCEYPFAGSITCDHCIFGSCSGKKDPRINPDEELTCKHT